MKNKDTKDKKKILVGEDEKAIASALEHKLEFEGFDVVLAGDGEEVLKAIEKDKFDLLLLDLIMPKMDGFAVLKELKEKQIKLPVIITSNLGQEEDKKRVKELGVSDYLIKSNVSIMDIVLKIKEFLNIKND